MSSNKKRRNSEREMMKEEFIKKLGFFTIDLSQVEGEGSFPCPRCGTLISPDDESEEVYKIIDTKVAGDELVEVLISCNKCRTTIKLIGFQHPTGEATCQ